MSSRWVHREVVEATVGAVEQVGRDRAHVHDGTEVRLHVGVGLRALLSDLAVGGLRLGLREPSRSTLGR
jgi:hypothetical protein